jgi:alpha-amylase
MSRLYALLFLALTIAPDARAQTSHVKKVLFQGFWWDYENDNYPNGWANYIADLAPRLKNMGVDAIWIPPSVKNFGPFVGYAPFDHYDLGDKYQKGRDTTRLGTKDELLRMVAVLHANGIEVVQDIVPNHVIGAGSDNGSGGQDPAAPVTACTDNWKNFRYVCYETPANDQSATDYLARKGRFPKNHHNYHPNTAHVCSAGLCDANADAWCWQAFGPDVCYYDGAYGASSNATYNPDQSTYSPYNNGGIGLNNGYMRKHTREWLIWCKKQMGFDGVRIDAVKHFPEYASEDFLYNLQFEADWADGGNAMFAVGEWVGSTPALDNWVTAVQNRSGTFDFNLRAFDASGGLYSMIYGNGSFDMGALPGAQQTKRYVDLSGVRIHRTVPFVNNHDTYRPQLDAMGNITGWNTGQELSPHVDVREPRLGAAYAVMSAMDGNPQVFFEDLLNVVNTGKRFSHLPTNTTDLPAHQDVVNIMKCHGALNFKGGSYKVRSAEAGHFNVLTGNNNDDNHLIIERSGKAIIAATDAWNTDQESWVDSDFAPGTVLMDYSGGIATTSTVQGDKRVNIKTRAVGYPSFAYSTTYADHGAHYHGYSIWAPVGIDINAYANAPILTTQEWEMENDLGDSHCQSLGQGGRTANNSLNARVIGKIFPAGNSTVSYTLYPGSPGTSLTLEFYDLNGVLIHATSGSADSITGNFLNTATRWITMKVRNTAGNTPGQKCWLKMAYYAPASVNSLNFPAATPVSIWTSNGGNSDWNNCKNWEEGNIPGCNDTVILPHPTDFLPAIDPCFTGEFFTGYCLPPTIGSVTPTQPLSCSAPTGSIAVTASGYGPFEYSVDDGASWQSSPAFLSLNPGSYLVKVRLKNLPSCTTAYSGNPVILNPPSGCCPSFTTPCSSGDYLEDFTLGSFSNLATGCGNPGYTNYSDYTGTGPNVQAGETYTATLKAGPNTQHFAVYIDLNSNGNFNDTGEFFPIGQASGGGTVSGNVLIPADQPAATRTLRVRSSNQPLSAADGCNSNLPAGETEDYSLFIFCPNHLAVNGAISSNTYRANVEITSSGVVGTAENVLFKAGTSILLQPGFEVQLGGVFEVMLEGCFP